MTIAAILDDKGREVTTIDAGARVAEAVALIAERRIGAMPVLKDGAVAGILSERDILYKLAEHGAGVLDKTVGEIMTAPATMVGKAMPILAALSLITRRRIRHLPVIEGGELVGLVSIGDLVKARIDRIEAEAAAMRDYIQAG